MINDSFFFSFHKVEVRVQLRGQKRRKEKLTEAGYYSWQEKIMNGHSFSLSSRLLHFSLATHVKYLWVETVIKAPWIVFLFTFP